MSDDSRVIVMNPPSHPLAVYVDGYAEQVDAPEFVLDDVIAAGTVVMAGERGLGKTSAIVPLVISCTQLLNGFPLRATIRRKVIYIAEDVAQVQRIISAMRHDGLIAADREEFNQWFLLVEAKRLSATDIAKVVPHYDDLWTPNQRIDGSIYMAPPVVVMDTSNATIDLDNISDNSEVSAAVATLRQSFGHICLILIGHVSKASRTDAKLVSFIGAGAWEGDTQQTLYLVCDGEERYLVIGKRRFEPDASEYRIISHVSTFDAKDKLGHTVEIKCFYGTPEATSSEEKEQVKAQRQAEQKAATWTAVQNRVLDYVKVNAGASKRDISETVTGKATTIRAAVEELVSRGELKTEEKNGTIHHYPVFGTQRDTVGHRHT